MQIHVARGGEQLGAFTQDEVRTRLASGQFLPTDFGWTDGQAEWTALSSFPGLAAAPPAMLAEAVPPPMPARTVPAAGATRRPATQHGPTPKSGQAIASLIFGILSVTILPILSSLPAIIFGHVARSRIRESNGKVGGGGMALAGLLMGYGGIALLPILGIVAGLALPVFGAYQSKEREVKSLSQAKQIAVACRQYAIDHNGPFPRTLEELVPDYLPDATLFICPLSGPSVPIGYEYYGGQDTDPDSNILLVSKGTGFRKRRVVVRVDTLGRVVPDMPELPPRSR